MKQRLVEMMSEIEAIQRQLGRVVDTETHKEVLKHPISEYHIKQYAFTLAQLKDSLKTYGSAIRCHTCNDTGWVRSQNQYGITLFEVNNPCLDCDKGLENKRFRDEKNRKAKEEYEAQQERRRLAQAQELNWRVQLLKVCVDDVISPISHLLDYEAINMLYKEYDYLCKRCMTAESWYMSEQYHLQGDYIVVSIPHLMEKEARLAWVKETIPFGLKAHEEFYVLEGHLLFKIAQTQKALTQYIYHTLTAYANSDEFLEAYYKQLQDLVSQVLSEQKNTNANTK